MKKMLFLLAVTGLAATPLLAQPPRGRTPVVVPGAHNVEGELILYGDANFTGARQVVSQASPTVSTPFAIKSLSLRPGDRWQVCANPNFRPPCTTLTRPIADAALVGIRGQVGSIRLMADPAAAGN